MNPTHPPGPGGWNEWLAAYADGELDGPTRRLVEEWLAETPEALELLRTQLDFSPTNRGLWQDMHPADPGEAAWGETLGRVKAGLGVTKPAVVPMQPRQWVWRSAAAACVAAALLGGWFAFKPAAVEPNKFVSPVVAAQPDEDPLAGFVVLPVATGDDVVIEVVRGDDDWVVALGRDPVAGGVQLAGPGDVQIEEFADGPFMDPRLTTAPGDAPMFYPAKPRTP